MLSEREVIIRLALALILGGLIGLERERLYVSIRTYSAGFRTHILVCVGSALAMVVSEGLHFEYKGDAARVAAQVISGIGFLGAGAILREGILVRGLTTAASLWVVACVGLAAGGGFYLAAVLGTLLVLFSLIILGALEDAVRRWHHRDTLSIVVDSQAEDVQMIGDVLRECGVQIKRIDIQKIPDSDRQMLEVAVTVPHPVNMVTVMNRLASLPGVHRVENQVF